MTSLLRADRICGAKLKLVYLVQLDEESAGCSEKLFAIADSSELSSASSGVSLNLASATF